MLNKIIKFLRITLVGAMLLTLSPLVSYAQYYNYNNNYNYYSPLNITTTNASNIGNSSASLNGLVNGTNLYSTYGLETWFEYGTYPNFGYSTVRINSNSGYANFIANVAGLSPNTVYYFRAIGQNAQGIVYGNTNSFRTNFGNTINNTIIENNIPVNPTIVTNAVTSISTRSVKLNSVIINSADNSTATWFEWGTIPTLGNMTPMVYLGTLTAAKHINTITGLAPATTYYFRAVVQNSSYRTNGATLSFTTNNVVVVRNNTTVEEKVDTTTTTNTAKEEVTNTSVLESTLGANAIGAGSFLPGNIIGWLLLILLVLVLILLSKYLYGVSLKGKAPKEDTHTPGH